MKCLWCQYYSKSEMMCFHWNRYVSTKDECNNFLEDEWRTTRMAIPEDVRKDILARSAKGESLKSISEDIGIPYKSVEGFISQTKRTPKSLRTPVGIPVVENKPTPVLRDITCEHCSHLGVCRYSELYPVVKEFAVCKFAKQA